MSMQHEEEEYQERGPAVGALARTGFGTADTTAITETASAATAARSTAIVQARIIQAMQRPRTFAVVRERVMADCDRPRFASAARYARPQGKKKNEITGEWEANVITGWSIRFVEAALAAMGNIEPTAIVLYDDDRKRILRCEVSDLERNNSWAHEITVEKTVERKKAAKGQALGMRTNSYGDPVFIVAATDDEFRLKENRAISMTLRTLGLRVIPADLLEEALDRVDATQRKEITGDPNRAWKETLDKLSRIGVKATDVTEYFNGRSIESATPEQILELRAIGATIAQGDATWKDVLAGSPWRPAPEDAPKEETEAAKNARQKVVDLVARGRKKKDPPPPAAAPATAGAGAAAPATPPRGADDGTLTPEQERAAFEGEHGSTAD